MLLRRCFGVSAPAAGPSIVLELEDLHWADDASLDFLTYLTQVNRDVPMLILAMTRPGLLERGIVWMGDQSVHQRIDLAPLDKTGSRLLANELLKKLAEIPTGLRELITSSSEGNPFYMEELVKMLVDQGAIETGGPRSDRWTLRADKLLGTKVPPTLTGVLQARLDGLPPTEKLALQQASVIGAVFWDRALIALDARAEQALPALVRRELALPQPGAARGDDLREYAFRHHILHQVTYDTLLKRTRRELHEKVAEWLAGLTGLRASDFLGITADHYERAGDLANACEYHARAAEHARVRSAHDAALAHAERALTLLSSTDQSNRSASEDHPMLCLRWRLVDVCVQTLDLQGRRDDQQAKIDLLGTLADALNDDSRRAHVALRRSEIALSTGQWAACDRAAQQAIALAERVGDKALRLTATARRARSVAHLGAYQLAKSLALQGLADAREYGMQVNEAELLAALAAMVFFADDAINGLEFARQSLSLARDLGDRNGEANALGRIGNLWMNLGQLETARRDLEEGWRLRRAHGDRFGECSSLLNLSVLARWQGDDSRALSLACSGLDIAVAVKASLLEAIALICLGYAELALGRHAAAAQAFERAQQTSHPIRHDATAGLSRVALAKGDMAAAMQQVESLLAYCISGGTLEGTQSSRGIELSCYHALARAGDTRASEWLARAHANLQAKVATIPDAELRQSFLTKIPEHREIAAAWAAWQRSLA